MADKNKPAEEPKDPNQEFCDKAVRALKGLCEKARAAQELHFAMALMPELRGAQDAGWNTAEEAVRAYDQYFELVRLLDKDQIVRARLILAFYLHVADGAGFYEMPKKMMLTIEGEGNNIYPFQNLVKKHQETGATIAPNANQIMKNLTGHAAELGLNELSDVFRDAFDADVRNAIAHSDYILAFDGMRLRKRNGGQPYIISWDDFDAIMSRGINLFSLIRRVVDEYVCSYSPPETIKSRLTTREPVIDYTIYYDRETGAFGWITGTSLPKGYGKGTGGPAKTQPYYHHYKA
jgi:hypothetical protein